MPFMAKLSVCSATAQNRESFIRNRSLVSAPERSAAPSKGWSVNIHPVRSTVFAPPRNRMQEHALNTCVKPVHDTPLQAPLVTTPPHHLHGQARAESTPNRVRNSCTHRDAFAMGLREAKAWCSLLKYPTDGQRDSKWNRKGVRR